MSTGQHAPPSIVDVVRVLAGKYEKGDAWRAISARLDASTTMERALRRYLVTKGTQRRGRYYLP